MRNWLFNSLLLLTLVVPGCCGRKGSEAGASGGRQVNGREAPRPGSEDQHKLDSLKQEKLKGKP